MNGVRRYLPWLLRDAAATIGVVGGVLLLGLALLLPRGGDLASADGVSRFTRGFLDQAALPLVLLAAGAGLGGDLAGGWYRVLFTQPVRPWAYYLARWLVGGALVGLVAVASYPAIGAGRALVAPEPVVVVLLLLTYALLGGTSLLCSTVSRNGWAYAAAVYVVAGVVGQAYAAGVDRWWVTLLHHVLPPFHLLNIASATLPGPGRLALVVAWGAGLVGLALVVIARRPLGAGGRA